MKKKNPTTLNLIAKQVAVTRLSGGRSGLLNSVQDPMLAGPFTGPFHLSLHQARFILLTVYFSRFVKEQKRERKMLEM